MIIRRHLKFYFGISEASKGITTYEELMHLCGYISYSELKNNIDIISLLENYNDITKYCKTDEDFQIINEILNCNTGYINSLVLLRKFATNKHLSPDEYAFLLETCEKITKYREYMLELYEKKEIQNIEIYDSIIDNSMAPLLNVGDIAIVEKDVPYVSGKTYLLKKEENYMIRKIITVENGIELHAMNPYYPVIKTTIDKITILGKVIRAEISSAFK